MVYPSVHSDVPVSEVLPVRFTDSFSVHCLNEEAKKIKAGGLHARNERFVIPGIQDGTCLVSNRADLICEVLTDKGEYFELLTNFSNTESVFVLDEVHTFNVDWNICSGDSFNSYLIDLDLPRFDREGDVQHLEEVIQLAASGFYNVECEIMTLQVDPLVCHLSSLTTGESLGHVILEDYVYSKVTPVLDAFVTLQKVYELRNYGS